MENRVFPISKLNIEVLDGDRGKNYPHQDELFKKGHCLFLSASNVTRDGFQFGSTMFISKEKDEVLRGGKLCRNDIVITTRGTVGNVAYYDENVPYKDIRINSGMLIVRCGKELNSKYVYYVLRSPEFQKQIRSIQTGSAQPQLPKSHFIKMLICVPKLEIQNKITSILSVLDRKIENNAKINDNLQQQARTIFHEWFIAPLQTDGSDETEFGMLPYGFSTKKVGELPIIVTDYVANGSFASLKTNVKLYQEPNYAYFIRNTDLKSDTFEVYVDEHSYNFLSKSRLFGGEIIISNVGDVGSVFLCPILDAPMTLGNNIIMLKPECDELRYYLYIWFKWSFGQGLIQGIKGGSAQPKFNKTDFRALPVILPPRELLRKFNLTVNPMFKAIEGNRSQNRNLASLRDALLPKLMAGELDVSDVKL